jgi:hypothetical protein
MSERAAIDEAEQPPLASLESNMKRLSPASAACLAAILLTASAPGAAAQALSLFRYEEQAQRHCLSDTVVWLDFATRRYYLRGQRRYGQGSTGTFTCRAEARRNGYRRSILGRR